jgi:hypothetical protein
MAFPSALALTLFVLLILAVSLQALAASGQFPREHRAATFHTPVGGAILFGSMAVSFFALMEGLMFAARTIPWYAAVIGAGAPILFAPLLLRPLPDAFVNGRAALLCFSGIAAVLAFVMLTL